jgi:outer membrane protein assembly factor BamB
MSLGFPRVRRLPLAVALLLTGAGTAPADDWPQWMGPKRDGVWRETGILDRFPPGGPKVRWRTPTGGGYAGPAVAGGRVYLTDRVLDPGVRASDDPFARTPLAGRERVRCLDEATGKVLWTHTYPCAYEISYPCGPRATPLVHDGLVYTLGAMGDLCCLKADTGEVVWSKNFVRDFRAPVPLWGFAAHPLLDGDRLVCLVGGPGGVVVAFDRRTGETKWKALSVQSSEIGYCPPVIAELAGKRQLIVWHPESINGLDPGTGAALWSFPFKVNANLTVPMPRTVGDLLFVTSFYNGPRLLRFTPGKPAPELVWRGRGRGEHPNETDKLHSIIPTPVIRDGHIYGVCSYGELRCLRLVDGKRVWQTLEATCGGTEPQRWANAFFVEHGDRFFLFNEKGDLIIARLDPAGYHEVDRAHVLEPTGKALDRRVLWSHPAFADRCLFARNDKEIVCVSLAQNDER